MKAKVPTLISAALLATLTSSALAAPQTKLVPPPPPVAAEKVQQPAAAPAAVPTLVQITPLATHTSRSMTAQQFCDEISVPPNQSKIPLTLKVTNGENGTAFQWFRMRMNGELLFSEQSLKGKRSASVDVSGLIPSGANQLVIDAAGVPGATLSWQLLASPITIASVEPASVSPGGKLTIKGANFATDTNLVNAVVNGSVADVVSTTATQMVVQLPETISAGPANLEIESNGLPKVVVPVKVAGAAAPVVTGTSMWAAPAGTEITVTGKFFSKNPSDNQVYFNNVAGQVTSAAADFLKVVVPSVGGTGAKQQSVPVFVVSNGLRSAGSVSFSIGPRSLDKNYAPSVKFPEQRTQNSSQAASVTNSDATFNAASQAGQTWNPANPSYDSTLNAGTQSESIVITPVGD